MAGSRQNDGKAVEELRAESYCRLQNALPSNSSISIRLKYFIPLSQCSVFSEMDLGVPCSQRPEQTLIRVKTLGSYYFILHLKGEENRLQIGEASLSGKRTVYRSYIYIVYIPIYMYIVYRSSISLYIGI